MPDPPSEVNCTGGSNRRRSLPKFQNSRPIGGETRYVYRPLSIPPPRPSEMMRSTFGVSFARSSYLGRPSAKCSGDSGMNVCQAIPARRYGRRKRVYARPLTNSGAPPEMEIFPYAPQPGTVRGEYDSGAVPRPRQPADISVVNGGKIGEAHLPRQSCYKSIPGPRSPAPWTKAPPSCRRRARKVGDAREGAAR